MARKRHWDPNNPNHFHILNGELAPTDYSGTEGVVQYADGIVDPKVQQWIAEHQTAMNKDEYKYINNPAYAAIQSKLNQAKSIYDWGNSAVGLPNNPNKTQWQHNYPHPELTFDTNGVGYKDGQTYLPGSGSNGFIVPGPSSTSFSQNYSYVPTNIPDKQILRTEFPTPQIISKEAYDAEKQRAVQEYINNNTRKEYYISPHFLFSKGHEVETVNGYYGRNLEYASPLRKKVIQAMQAQDSNLDHFVWTEGRPYITWRSVMPFPLDYQTAKALQTDAINSWIDDEKEYAQRIGSDSANERVKYWARYRDSNYGIKSNIIKPSANEAEQNAQINYGNLTNNIFAKGGPIKHTIAKGETLSSISKKYGVPISVIQQANGLTSDKIIAGNTLTIIPPIQSVNFMQDVARNSTPVNPTTRNNNVVSDRNKVVQGQHYYDNATPSGGLENQVNPNTLENQYAKGGIMTSWNDLSIRDKRLLIKEGVKNGITNIDDIISIYNNISSTPQQGINTTPTTVYADGGPIGRSSENNYEDYFEWLQQLADKKSNEWGEPYGYTILDMLNNNAYDYKAFYDQDPQSAWEYLNSPDGTHFTDIGKTVNHETFSNESMYSSENYGDLGTGANPYNIVGPHWNGEQLIDNQGNIIFDGNNYEL